MKNVKYKGYTGILSFSDEDGCFIGKVAGIDDVIAFDGITEGECIENCLIGINEYLDFCKERGEEPNTPREV